MPLIHINWKKHGTEVAKTNFIGQIEGDCWFVLFYCTYFGNSNELLFYGDNRFGGNHCAIGFHP